MFIYPYKSGSASARDLSIATGFKRIRRGHSSRFKGGADKVVINWGNSGELPQEINKCTIINKPEAVAIASNKLTFFKVVWQYNEHNEELGHLCAPRFTTEKRLAERWLGGGSSVLARTVLNGHSGQGIVFLDANEAIEIPDAPLYVEYIPKKQEYRVHVCNGQVVDLQRKARCRDVPDEQVNWRIRNHANGFIFARNDLVVPDCVSEQALLAVKVCGLDFGAVDVIYNDNQGRAYVLEINTAPGLAGETLSGYAERFISWEADL